MHIQKTLKTYALAGILAVSAVLAFAGPAQAQVQTQAPSTLEITVTPFDAPIRPLAGVGQAQISVTYGYFAAGNTALSATKVKLTVAEAPSWAVITISPSTLLIPIAGGAPTQAQVQAPAKTATLYVTTTADAPAFQAANIKINAVAEPNNPIAGTNADASTLVQADYFSIIDAQIAQPIRVVRPQTAVEFPVTITNFGNGNTKVAFEVPAESVTGGLTVPVPNPVTLEARQTGGKLTQQTVPFSISTPFKNGYMNQPGLVTVKLKAVYALNSQVKGEEVQFSILATTKGFYAPGPELVFVALGLVAAVGLAGARRRRA